MSGVKDYNLALRQGTLGKNFTIALSQGLKHSCQTGCAKLRTVSNKLHTFSKRGEKKVLQNVLINSCSLFQS